LQVSQRTAHRARQEKDFPLPLSSCNTFWSRHFESMCSYRPNAEYTGMQANTNHTMSWKLTLGFYDFAMNTPF
jgi:hypothetical protein